MSDKIKVLMVASEFEGIAKTGGLADAVKGLSKSLQKKGVDLRVVLPRYYIVDKNMLRDFGFAFNVEMGSMGNLSFGVFEGTFEGINIYFVDYESFFGRAGLYDDENKKPYKDNSARFVFLSKASLEIAKTLNFQPDVVHAHDWHTALIPALLRTIYANDIFFKNTASVLTIHNLQHQGVFPKTTMDIMGIGWEHFNPFEFEALDNVNLLKGGIAFADAISTVSRRYAEEIQTPVFGFGLDEHLKAHSHKLFGILNGVDYSNWNPSSDKYLAKNYDVDNLDDKIHSKIQLQRTFLLKEDKNMPLIGFIGRLYNQKGIGLIAEIFDKLMELDLQFILLGSGESWAEEFFVEKSRRYADKFGCFIGYSEELAHKIEAGCDLFLMPSLFEPCGLNQIYSLRYGTLPVVHGVGGLLDTVEDIDLMSENGTGFVFYEPNGEALLNALKRAIDTYVNDKKTFKSAQKRAMLKRFDWDRQADKYIKLYEFAYAYRFLKNG